jgi:HEPN domain-containing protein
MPSRHADWFAQAERDLDLADLAAAHDRHEWACFAAQQGAEKAVKALHLERGQDAWGHRVAKLLEELPWDIDQELIELGRILDTYYIPARYPNGHPEGAPFEQFGARQSREAIGHARQILEFVRSQMA